jgi:nicotinate-nucleotide adenylyltransferase
LTEPEAARGGAPAAPERLGLFGGTFDPPHVGHLRAAEACVAALALHRLVFMVANDPWLKAPARRITPAEDRYAMVAAAVAGMPRMEVGRLEIERGGPTYTVDTVHQLVAAARDAGHPAPEVFLVVGADLVDQLPSWERVDELRPMVTLAVVPRPGSPVELPPGWRAVAVPGVAVDLSSSDARRRLEAGLAVTGMVPEPVVRCIRSRGLYAVGR